MANHWAVCCALAETDHFSFVHRRELGGLAACDKFWQSKVTTNQWYRYEQRRIAFNRRIALQRAEPLDRQWWDNDTDSGS